MAATRPEDGFMHCSAVSDLSVADDRRDVLVAALPRDRTRAACLRAPLASHAASHGAS